MRTAVVRIPENNFSVLRKVVRELNGKIKFMDEEGLKEELLAKLVDFPLEEEEIIPQETIKRDLKKYGIDLYR